MARLVSASQQNSRRRDMANQLPALRVLIVDDEPLICWSLAETLSECGDVATEAKNGARRFGPSYAATARARNAMSYGLALASVKYTSLGNSNAFRD